jgi:flagellar biosynthesis protein
MTDETPRINVLEGEAAQQAQTPGAIQKAVALKYDPRERKEAPKIVASGSGKIAEQILELAFAHGVKVREDAELVEILALLDVDSPIPLEAYAAVAEILSYVYKANNAYRKGLP